MGDRDRLGGGARLPKAVAAALAELKRQEAETGNHIATDGTWVQIDGSFRIEPLVRAIIASIDWTGEDD